MEELDSPREFYFDAGAQKFYYFHNATSGTPPPPSWTFEVPMLTTLISVEVRCVCARRAQLFLYARDKE